jgi:hypothetical protein
MQKSSEDSKLQGSSGGVVFSKTFEESSGRLIPSKYSRREIGRSEFSEENSRNNEDRRIYRNCKGIRVDEPIPLVSRINVGHWF